MKKIFIISLIGLLSACGATPEEQTFDLQRVQNSLPEGCVINYAGEVRVTGSDRASRIFYTVCGAVTTTSISKEAKSGKSTYTVNEAVVNINE